jgi:hypothetical protein
MHGGPGPTGRGQGRLDRGDGATVYHVCGVLLGEGVLRIRGKGKESLSGRSFSPTVFPALA